MEGFLIPGWKLMLPWCGRTSALVVGHLSPRAGSMSLSQSVTTRLGWGFYTLRGDMHMGNL